MNQNAEIKFNGLKCDYCDWKDKTIPVEQFKHYLNKPCPKCGHNILTKRDYKVVKRLLFFTKIINRLPFKHSNDIVTATIQFDGESDPVINDIKTTLDTRNR